MAHHYLLNCLVVALFAVLCLLVEHHYLGLFAVHPVIHVFLASQHYLLLHDYGLLCLQFVFHVTLKKVFVLTVVAYPHPFPSFILTLFA